MYGHTDALILHFLLAKKQTRKYKNKSWNKSKDSYINISVLFKALKS